jgi:hypothetical protein
MSSSKVRHARREETSDDTPTTSFSKERSHEMTRGWITLLIAITAVVSSLATDLIGRGNPGYGAASRTYRLVHGDRVDIPAAGWRCDVTSVIRHAGTELSCKTNQKPPTRLLFGAHHVLISGITRKPTRLVHGYLFDY